MNKNRGIYIQRFLKEPHGAISLTRKSPVSGGWISDPQICALLIVARLISESNKIQPFILERISPRMQTDLKQTGIEKNACHLKINLLLN